MTMVMLFVAILLLNLLSRLRLWLIGVPFLFWASRKLCGLDAPRAVDRHIRMSIRRQSWKPGIWALISSLPNCFMKLDWAHLLNEHRFRFRRQQEKSGGWGT
ncbi:hypothetical protein AWB68_06765 [Caballeronia choica]|jgi:hypothetical protein|uniref:Uncharacterized protein n=1 Tax=Caballeronia choica TaxID=326476 RepID=A0A158KQQ7_9BURK|nr:hypothetical protein AWB68_06765 [Caballeronia choica]